MMTRRMFSRLIAGAPTLAVGGCGKSAGYRYKLTLSLDTPQGLKTGYNVVEIYGGAVSIPASGVVQKAKGEALYLDTGGRPLIALLGKSSWSASNPFAPHPDASPQPERPFYAQWEWNNPTGLLRFLFVPTSQVHDRIDVIRKVSSAVGKRALTTYDLPDLVTFADVNDPKSVLRVDSNDLEPTLGAGAKWRSMTIEVTDERLTTGIEDKLPWLRAMTGIMHLDGSTSGGGPGSRFANSLQPSDFLHKEYF